MSHAVPVSLLNFTGEDCQNPSHLSSSNVEAGIVDEIGLAASVMTQNIEIIASCVNALCVKWTRKWY